MSNEWYNDVQFKCSQVDNIQIKRCTNVTDLDGKEFISPSTEFAAQSLLKDRGDLITGEKLN